METATKTAIEAMRSTGVPRDQLVLLLAGGYVPQPKQAKFHAACRECDADNGPTEVGFGGARGPGKSHALLAQMALDDCQRYDNLKCLLLRRVGKAVRESFEDLRSKVLGRIEHNYNKSSGTVEFPNGSRIIMGHFKNDADIDNYLGLEYDIIGIEEATTLSASKYRSIRTCNRTSRDDVRPRMYTNANPGGVGHTWYKHRYIVPYRRGEQDETRFIPGTVDDNAFINEGYRKNLEALTGWKKKAWLKGDWDIMAGQFFSNFDYNGHSIEPMPVPEYWPYRWVAMDYGWTHPTAAVLLAQTNEGIIYVVDEYRLSKKLVAVHAGNIKDMLARWDVRLDDLYAFVGGGDMWQKDRDGKSVADEYQQHFPMLERADMGRISGASVLLSLLGDPSEGIGPGLKFYNTCSHTMDTISRMQHDPNRPDDVMKEDVDETGVGGDDLYDALRYGVMVTSSLSPVSLKLDNVYY